MRRRGIRLLRGVYICNKRRRHRRGKPVSCGAATHTRHVHRRRSYGTYLLLPCGYAARQPERYGSCSHNARYRRFRLYDLACRGFKFFDRKQILHGISPVCGQTRRVRQTHILLRRNGLSFHCCRSYLRICS